MSGLGFLASKKEFSTTFTTTFNTSQSTTTTFSTSKSTTTTFSTSKSTTTTFNTSRSTTTSYTTSYNTSRNTAGNFGPYQASWYNVPGVYYGASIPPYTSYYSMSIWDNGTEIYGGPSIDSPAGSGIMQYTSGNAVYDSQGQIFNTVNYGPYRYEAFYYRIGQASVSTTFGTSRSTSRSTTTTFSTSKSTTTTYNTSNSTTTTFNTSNSTTTTFSTSNSTTRTTSFYA